MSIQAASADFASSSTSFQWIYDAFLSFRGLDTRTSFIDHLYHALIQNGIWVFKDDPDLRKGKIISTELFKAIELSRFAIVVFSENYASSTWCLDELVKIVECNKDKGLIVLPVFYHVNPSDIRKQNGNFRLPPSDHQEIVVSDPNRVQRWRNALTEMANHSGWHVTDQRESEIIKDIVKQVSSGLSIAPKFVHKDLVGMESRVKELIDLMGTDSNDVRFVGVWGMRGIGKTTLAEVVYDRMSYYFEGRSFLANVREVSRGHGGVEHLQTQLLSEVQGGLSCDNIWNDDCGAGIIQRKLRHKRVLLVIDDVDDVDQLEKLAGDHDWFGSGSKIIITTTDEHLLLTHGVDRKYIYEARGLANEKALKLFSLKAFKDVLPTKELSQLSEDFVKYAGGLPLALKVLGSFLFKRDIQQWRSALARLRKGPEKKINKVLKISLDGLEEEEKKIFLHVACFFKGCLKDYVTNMLNGCGLSAEIGIRVLIDKSLLTISTSNTLQMHDLLQEMGRDFIRSESPDQPGKRRFLWDKEDIHHVLTTNTGTNLVEGIMLNQQESIEQEIELSPNTFSKMQNLKLLKLHNSSLPRGLKCLPNELVLLEWGGFPLRSLPASYQPNNLVRLEMRKSNIERLWEGTIHLCKLKYMDVSFSKQLMKTPNLTGAPNLEELYFEGCSKLKEIHGSTVQLKTLEILRLKDCVNLESLPGCIGQMGSLICLNLKGCSKFNKFPEINRDMKSLRLLDVSETAIEAIPSSVDHLNALWKFYLRGCRNLVSVASNIFALKCIEQLDFEDCSKLQTLPFDCVTFSGQAITLALDGTAIVKQPGAALFRLSNKWFYPFSSTKKLDLSYREIHDETVLNILIYFSSLEELKLLGNYFRRLPSSISQLVELRLLNLNDCRWLHSLTELPPNLLYLFANDCVSLEILSVPPKSCMNAKLRIECLNCVKLGHNQQGSIPLSVMSMYIQGQPEKGHGFEMYVPGHVIPEWFEHQSEGNSINMHLPPNLFDDIEWMGISLCFVITEACVCDSTKEYVARCVIQADGLINEYVVATSFRQILFGQLNSHCLWIHYLPRAKFLELPVGLTMITITVNQSFHMEARSCGVRVVYQPNAVGGFNKATNRLYCSMASIVDIVNSVFG